ncbi:hypothetical protein ACSFA8_23415 [Variovorax sp. RT4R15]|uniref:hypothetical protein n=1 Tax=Variovorax sp. RT4R15 TaxID=3443737 RepID=UPI003F4867EF
MSLLRTRNMDAMVASRAPEGLERILSPLDLALAFTGAIVGTGILLLTATGALTAGPETRCSNMRDLGSC